MTCVQNPFYLPRDSTPRPLPFWGRRVSLAGSSRGRHTQPAGLPEGTRMALDEWSQGGGCLSAVGPCPRSRYVRQAGPRWPRSSRPPAGGCDAVTLGCHPSWGLLPSGVRWPRVPLALAPAGRSRRQRFSLPVSGASWGRRGARGAVRALGVGSWPWLSLWLRGARVPRPPLRRVPAPVQRPWVPRDGAVSMRRGRLVSFLPPWGSPRRPACFSGRSSHPQALVSGSYCPVLGRVSRGSVERPLGQ